MIDAVVYHPWRVVVLKFDSSVLLTPDDNTQAVHQVYRYLREAYRVLVVVSSMQSIATVLSYPALQGMDQEDVIPSAANFVEFVASGETASACLFMLALERVGIKAKKLNHHCVKTTASLLNAAPVRLATDLIFSLFESYSVLVLPGALGCDEANRTTLLGRHGADSMALFVAWTLQAAQCIFFANFKTADETKGLDPKLDFSGYETICIADALTLPSGLIQHKAFKFAEMKSMQFKLEAFHGSQMLVVGSEQSVLTEGSQSAHAAVVVTPSPLKIVLLGVGAVALRVLTLLASYPAQFKVMAVVVDDLTTISAAARGILSSFAVVQHWRDALHSGCDVVIDTADGLLRVDAIMTQALEQGCHVITSQQALMFLHGHAWTELAQQQGVECRYASPLAWVASLPAVKVLCQPDEAKSIKSFILVAGGAYALLAEQLRLGHSLSYAIAMAQQFGLITGQHSVDFYHADLKERATLLSRAVFGRDPDQVVVQPCVHSPQEAILQAKAEGRYLQLLACCEQDHHKITLKIEQKFMPLTDPLAQVTWDEQAILLRTMHEECLYWQAKTRGVWAMAEVLFSELWQCGTRGNRIFAVEGLKESMILSDLTQV